MSIFVLYDHFTALCQPYSSETIPIALWQKSVSNDSSLNAKIELTCIGAIKGIACGRLWRIN